MAAAERELDRADLADEPFWIQFFTSEQLATVQEYAPAVMRSSAGMQRREVLVASTLAASPRRRRS